MRFIKRKDVYWVDICDPTDMRRRMTTVTTGESAGISSERVEIAVGPHGEP
jgi:hypothetical protein